MGDVDEWLERLGLSQYRAVFAEHDIDREILPDLTDQDLEKLGLSLGHRKKLLRAIAELDRSGAQREAEASPRAAERRQLTVLFGDLVGSTELSVRLDPEDLGRVIGAYQECCATVVKRWGGHIARYLGDGVLAYFGYPLAHEDDAERAVRAGLELAAAMRRLQAENGTSLAARVGIATGVVMVGELVGGGAPKEEAVVGETPNLAARLQALADPGTVVIAATTRRLLGGLFALTDLGPVRLKGFSEPLAAFRVEGEGGAEARFEARQTTGLTPLVGRAEEIALLLRRWRQAKDGEGQVVLLGGEPGIGKSRLVRELRERLEGEPHVRLLYQCSPHHTTSPLHPVIEQLERAASFARDDPPETRLDKLEALLARATDQLDQAVPLIAALLGLPTGERYALPELSPQRRKQLTLEALVEQLEGLAAAQPVLLAYEDAHWVDPSTLELLDLLVERVRGLPVLAVLTYRPEFRPPWSGHAHVTGLPLNRLGRCQGAALVARIAGGKALPGEILEQIVTRTDGVPLFVEELTKTVLESGLLRDAGDRYELSGSLPSLAIPATLHDSLMARLDRLAPVKDIAQGAAVIGREFSHELMAAVSSLSQADLSAALDQLVAAELIFRRGTPPEATYSFKHALVQDAAYQSLLKRTRQRYHRQIAELLESRFPDVVEAQPELLAGHYTEAGSAIKAVLYWQRAGEKALKRSASQEATAHLTKGLEVLRVMPEGRERAQRELDLLTAMGHALTATKGYASPEVEPAYRRALELCQELGDTPRQFSALHGLWHFHLHRGELHVARSLAEQLVDVAKGQQDAGLDLAAHRSLGYTLQSLGDLEPGRSCLERVIASYDPAVHGGYAFRHGGADPGVGSLCIGAWGVWALGHSDQALGQNTAGLALARKLGHPLSEALALTSAATVHQLRGEPKAAQEHAEAALRIAEEWGFALYVGWARVRRGWALGARKASAEAIIEMRKGLDACRAGPSPIHTVLLASLHSRLGQMKEGLVAAANALAEVARTGERFWEAELQRLKGQLLLQADLTSAPDAEACFHRAIEIARSQKARSWELRAATSLARLWRDQSRRAEAYDLLAPVYAWFTEGFETQDLKDARALLDELA